MPLEHHTPGRAVPPRRWYRPAREPLPPEPGRLVVSALLASVRRERGCVTPGDDRIETRIYAVKRYLFRLGYAARSARYATSVEQLVVGLAPVMGWGAAPRVPAERARWVRAHRRTVQRWLDDLQRAGLVDHEPERDEHGYWWRTQIVLRAAPDPSGADLATAALRAAGWRKRVRRRRQLAAIRRRSAEPSPGTRERRARGRSAALHQARRRAAVDRTIAAARERRALLTHPFGAPPSSAQPQATTERSRSTGTPQSSMSTVVRSGPARSSSSTLAAETDARPPAVGDDLDVVAARRVAERRSQEGGRLALLRAHVARRVAEVEAWPAGSACPTGRLREAWVAHRHGVEWVTQSGAALGGPISPRADQRLRQARALYERYAAERPAAWPGAAPGALLVLASQRRAEVIAGDIARLLRLAKQMRAAALERDRTRLRHQVERARRRATASPGPIRYRVAIARWESPEQRRQRVRDRVLLDGGEPALWPNASVAIGSGDALPDLTVPDRHEALDGVGARAARYRDERRRGLYDLASNRPEPS